MYFLMQNSTKLIKALVYSFRSDMETKFQNLPSHQIFKLDLHFTVT